MGDIDPGLLQDFSIDEFLTPDALTQLTQASDGASADLTLSLLGTQLEQLVGDLVAAGQGADAVALLEAPSPRAACSVSSRTPSRPSSAPCRARTARRRHDDRRRTGRGRRALGGATTLLEGLLSAGLITEVEGLLTGLLQDGTSPTW